MNRQTRPRVLVVDNDEDVCLYLRKKLAEAGYETTSTWSGIEASSSRRRTMSWPCMTRLYQNRTETLPEGPSI